MINDYLKQANAFLDAAKKEFQEGKTTNDMIKIRDAAEKAWNAVVQATNGLFIKKGKPVPRSHSDRYRGLREIAPDLRDRFGARAYYLHQQCFYEGICSLDLIEEDIKKVGEYIKDTAKEVLDN